MKGLAKFFLQNRALSWLLLVLILGGGIFSYYNMGKLEDAPFTIKQAVVTTSYPGASPMEVQQQVTDVLEEAIQSLGELYYLKTDNRAGLSKITVYVKKEIRADEMQQLWDKLRRKVGDVQSKLPAGAGPPVVNDDFGDVLGVFYGLSSETHTYRELEDQAKRIKNELLNVKDVAKVELFGVQSRTIDITVNPALLSSTGVTMADIASAFERQNKVVDAGGLETSSHRLRVEASGSFSSLEELENLTVVSRQGEYFRLGEIADISESYVRPARNLMKVGNVPAVGIAISTVSDGNVVEMAELVANRVSDLREEMPDGYNLDIIYDQGHESAVANEGFVWNLILSVLTVVAVLLFFIGFKNGILIGSGLIFSIFGTLIYMQFSGIALQRMSLAAIIIAMGMLVDNAIVVYDAALVNMQRGMRKRKAILDAVSGTSMPLLGATLIAVLTFLPVYLSPHITGEILSSLFIVIAVSLLLSWILAITQNVFFVQEFVRRPRPDELKGELFSGRAYDLFRQALRWTIQRRYVVLGAMVLLLVIAGWAFRFIPQQFMPLLNKQYFSVDVWLPEGTRIEESDRQMTEMTAYLNSLEGVKKVSSFVGQTPPRYYLANAAYGPQPNYAQCLVEADTPEKSRELQAILYDRLPAMFPDALVRVNSFEINSIPQALIEARFCGDDPEVLDSLTNLALEIMRKNPKVLNARNEWGNMALMIKADFLPSLSGNANASYTGNPLELYRELPSIETPLYFQGRDTKYGASVTMLQPVYSGGALKAGLEKSRKEKESALYEEKRVTNDVLYQADQYYWNKVACEEMVEVAAGFKKSVAALVEVVRHRVEEEYTDRNDLLMAEVKLNDAEFRLEQARNEAEVARLSMNSFSGEASDKVILTDSLVVPLTEVQVYEQTLETVMAHRPELRIAANQVAIQQSAARIANSRYLPKLSVGVDGSYSSPGYDFNSDLDPNYMVYAKLSVPIFEWGKRKNTRRIGKLDVNRALENQSKVADGVRLEVETAYYTYTQAVRQVCLTESSLAKAATSEQLAMDKYKEGTISIVEVLNAQMYHQEAELNHIRSKLRAQLAKSSLERAAGRLGEY